MAKNILVDAGPLIALFLRNDRHHERVTDFAKNNVASLLTTWPVITGACHFLNQAGKKALFGLMKRGGLTIADIALADLDQLLALIGKYRNMDLADASLVACGQDPDYGHYHHRPKRFCHLSYKERQSIFEPLVAAGRTLGMTKVFSPLDMIVIEAASVPVSLRPHGGFRLRRESQRSDRGSSHR